MYIQYPGMVGERPVFYWLIDRRWIEQHAVKKKPLKMEKLRKVRHEQYVYPFNQIFIF